MRRARLCAPSVLAVLLLLAGLARAQGAEGNATAASRGLITLDVRLPEFPTQEEDEYLCTSVALPDQPVRLTSVESLSDMAVVHHMLLFGALRRPPPTRRRRRWRPL